MGIKESEAKELGEGVTVKERGNKIVIIYDDKSKLDELYLRASNPALSVEERVKRLIDRNQKGYSEAMVERYEEVTGLEIGGNGAEEEEEAV